MYFMIYFQIESLNGREFLLIFTCIPNQMDIGTKKSLLTILIYILG